MGVEDKPFVDLPEALVEEMLENSFELSSKLSDNFKNIQDRQSEFRQILSSKNMVEKDSSLIKTRTYPTSCGIDGSFTIERLLSTDLVATAAVAVEGIVPPSEIRHWPKPRHFCYVDSMCGQNYGIQKNRVSHKNINTYVFHNLKPHRWSLFREGKWAREECLHTYMY